MPDSLGLYSKNASIYNDIALHCLFCSQRFCAKDKMWSSRSERRCPVPFATDRQLDTRLFLCVCVWRHFLSVPLKKFLIAYSMHFTNWIGSRFRFQLDRKCLQCKKKKNEKDSNNKNVCLYYPCMWIGRHVHRHKPKDTWLMTNEQTHSSSITTNLLRQHTNTNTHTHKQ